MLLDDGATRAAIVVCDLISMPKSIVVEARKLVEARTGKVLGTGTSAYDLLPGLPAGGRVGVQRQERHRGIVRLRQASMPSAKRLPIWNSAYSDERVVSLSTLKSQPAGCVPASHSATRAS